MSLILNASRHLANPRESPVAISLGLLPQSTERVASRAVCVTQYLSRLQVTLEAVVIAESGSLFAVATAHSLNSGQALSFSSATCSRPSTSARRDRKRSTSTRIEQSGFALVDASLDKACRLQIDIIHILCDRQFTQSGQRFRVSSIHFAGKPPFTAATSASAASSSA